MNKRKLSETVTGVKRFALVHPCEHPGCGKWGYFGYRVNILRGEGGVWYCAEHREDNHAD